jgi:hypothetical protein
MVFFISQIGQKFEQPNNLILKIAQFVNIKI